MMLHLGHQLELHVVVIHPNVIVIPIIIFPNMKNYHIKKKQKRMSVQNFEIHEKQKEYNIYFIK